MSDTDTLFVHHRRVIWADSDPAGIAYTGRFPHFALEAIEAWCAARLGFDWYQMHRQLGGVEMGLQLAGVPHHPGGVAAALGVLANG